MIEGVSPSLAFFETGCTGIAAACAVYVAFRDSRWRKNGLAKQLSDRIQEARDLAVGWHESDRGKRLLERMDATSERIQDCENRLDHSATKVELAQIAQAVTKVEGAVERVESMVRDAAGGVDRIESILLQRALRND